MDSSTGLHQDMSSNSLENMLVCSKSQQDKKPRPQPEQSLKCPRCDSTNTKFCYYNNYSLSQPRYFCKACRRYWTKGGTLRNVPVGGGCRKNKRPSSSSAKKTLDEPLNSNSSILPSLSYDSNDLTLAFSRLQRQRNGQLGFDDREISILGNPNATHCDFLGNPSIANYGPIIPSFLDTHNHNVGYGYGNGNVGENLMAYEEINGVTSMKQEFGKEGENRVLWGFPWQLNGDGNIGEIDSTRENWNGFTPSSHGLLNSPLM